MMLTVDDFEQSSNSNADVYDGISSESRDVLKARIKGKVLDFVTVIDV